MNDKSEFRSFVEACFIGLSGVAMVISSLSIPLCLESYYRHKLMSEAGYEQSVVDVETKTRTEIIWVKPGRGK